jgi:hypothetical protein
MDIILLRDRVVTATSARYAGSYQSASETLAASTRATTPGTLLPERLIQLNPSFESGRSIEELAATGLEPACCWPRASYR